jgi:hypothetical protein
MSVSGHSAAEDSLRLAQLAAAPGVRNGGWVIADGGYQPFIAVVAAAGGAETEEVCLTQNEAADFIERIRSQPLLSGSRLLDGVCRALACDDAGAVESLLGWIVQGSACSDEIVVAEIADPPFPAFVGYPLFRIGDSAKDSPDPALRAGALRRMCAAFEAAPGNDALRFCVIENARRALLRFDQMRRRVGDPVPAMAAPPPSDDGPAPVDVVEPGQPAAVLAGVLRSGQAFLTVAFQVGGRAVVLRCTTQNHEAAFLAELSRQPQAAASGLLRGLRLALEGEFYDAGGAIFDWIERGDQGCRTDIFPRELSAAGETLALHYPAYWVEADSSADAASTDPRGAAERTEAITDLLQAYHTSSGNDGAKWRLVEGLALGLAKRFGSLGEYRRAADAVAVALAYSPKSLHLRAADFALELKLIGSDVPDRLVKFIGPDNGALLGRICSEPFKRFDIGPSGDVLVCCGHWVPTSIGNILTQDVDQILNSEAALKLRASMLDGSYKYCNHLECTSMIQEILPRKEKVKDPVLRAAVDTGELRVSSVESVLFAFDQTCNLSCPSCRETRIVEKASLNEAKTKAIEEKLTPLLKGLRVLNINPAGEVFASKPSRKLLQMLNRDDCPELQIDMISNGMLFSEKEWRKFPNLKGMVRTVRISTDGATKDTFETLRRLGVWEVFVQNMTFLGELRRAGEIPQLKFSFTYQLGNFREMVDFVRFARSFNCDYVLFERLQNLGAFSWDQFRERAVHLNNHPLHADFLQVVSNPIFGERDVWHDFEWEGVASLSTADTESRVRFEGA